jgi:23S rRNA (guanosine2251-2'-O)-methyltransferase
MAQYIYGKNVVKQLIANQSAIHQLYLSKEKPDQELLLLAKNNRILVKFLTASEFKQFEGVHQNVVAAVDDFKTHTLEECLLDLKEQMCFILLDGLEDPHNLGAILRTADATMMDGVIIPKHGSVHLTSTVAKVSTGAIDTVKTIEVVNLNRTMETLKKNGFWIYASEYSETAKDYRSIDYRGRIALVLGSEGKGISRLVLKNCDETIKIPLYGQITSLNVSVSAAVLMYEVLNQRYPLK